MELDERVKGSQMLFGPYLTQQPFNYRNIRRAS